MTTTPLCSAVLCFTCHQSQINTVTAPCSCMILDDTSRLHEIWLGAQNLGGHSCLWYPECLTWDDATREHGLHAETWSLLRKPGNLRTTAQKWKGSVVVLSARWCGGKRKAEAERVKDCAQDLPAHAHKLFSQWRDRTEASQVTPVILWSSNLHVVGETGAAAREYRPGERVSRPLALFLFTYSYLHGNMFIVGAGFKHPGTRCFHGIKCKVYYSYNVRNHIKEN